MELFKQEMELFHRLPELWSKNLFYIMSLIFTKEFIIDSQNRKWNYPNRKWDYFSQFWASDQKTSFTTSSPYLPTNTKLILKTGNVIIATLGSILDSQLDWKSFKFQLARWSLREAELRREPHPPTTHPPPNLRYRNFSPIWCRVPTLGLISNQIPSIGKCCVPPPSASPKS